jgi:NAD(P)H-dependent FMN reductase
MKRYLLINASPRPKGTSAMLAGMLEAHLKARGCAVSLLSLYPHLNRLEALVDGFRDADALVVLGPCYVNTFPADTYAALEVLAAHPEAHHAQKIYGVIQGGMPYAHTHRSGLEALRLFAKSCGLSYGGGFVMGLGAMLNGGSLDRLPNAGKVKRQLNAFFDHVAQGEDSPDSVYEKALLHLPTIAWRLMARWANADIDKRQRAHGVRPGQPSPYAAHFSE